MPLPKRRHSKARGRKRRTHQKLDLPTYTHCSHCDQPVVPHRVCTKCGWYNGAQVMTIKEKKGKKKKTA